MRSIDLTAQQFVSIAAIPMSAAVLSFKLRGDAQARDLMIDGELSRLATVRSYDCEQ